MSEIPGDEGFMALEENQKIFTTAEREVGVRSGRS